jgi:hypothetical protein
MYNLMTGASDDEELFKALTNASTILLKIGSFVNDDSIYLCSLFSIQGELRKINDSTELNNNTNNIDETHHDGTISLEQLHTATYAEPSLVQWLENIHLRSSSQSLAERIHNYHQDILR